MVKLFKYKISTLEIIVFFAFVFYLIFNIETPTCLLGIIDSPQGIIFLMVMVLLLFIYVNPILSILALFVAYEMIRRSSLAVENKPPNINFTPSKIQKERRMGIMNIPNAFMSPKTEIESFKNVMVPMEMVPMAMNMNDSVNLSKKTLEEEIVSSMAPIGVNEQIGYIDSAFKPVLENSHNASIIE